MNIVTDIKGPVKVENVILSVFDKTKLDLLVLCLIEANPSVKFYSSTGTYRKIKEILGDELAEKNLIEIAEYTGYPEMQGGLVKTLHPMIHMGILAERINETHDAELIQQKAVRFDLVVCNLYPFAEAVAKEGCTIADAIANIDIGGPTMSRGTSKNFCANSILCDPGDYKSFCSELELSGSISLGTRLTLMKKLFAMTAEYDRQIAEYFAGVTEEDVRKVFTVHN